MTNTVQTVERCVHKGCQSRVGEGSYRCEKHEAAYYGGHFNKNHAGNRERGWRKEKVKPQD